jgi:competence protein ComEC
MSVFTSIPFLRILPPFLAGILLGIHLALDLSVVWLFPVCLLLVFFQRRHRYASFHKYGFMIAADVFFCLAGLILTGEKDLARQPDYYGNLADTEQPVTLLAAVRDVPAVKAHYTRCELKVFAVRVDGRFLPARGQILAYFRQDAPTAGQSLVLSGRLGGLSPPANPFEFDYRSYLYHRQVYHTMFAGPGAFSVLPRHDLLNPVWQAGLRCKVFILSQLKRSGLSARAYAICAALITGYDEAIDRPVMEAFAHSGTLHVLSVSGLHTGLIYLALNFLFQLVDRAQYYRRTRFVFITLFLWGFALITGFSAPVLRAVIMFNLLGAGRLYTHIRPAHQVNILLFSAFLLLCHQPFYILDIGFLLSYSAMFGLLYFQPRFYRLWSPPGRIADLIWQSVTASLAATLSTLPVTLFCFQQFPLWFVVCNIVVIPLTFLLLILAFLLVCQLTILSGVVNGLVDALVWFIRGFDREGAGFIDRIHFTGTDALFMTLLIVLFALAFRYRSSGWLLRGMILLIAWQLVALTEAFRVKRSSFLTVYQLRKERGILVKNRTRATIHDPVPEAYAFSVRPHLAACNSPDLQSRAFNLLRAGGERVLFLEQAGYWPLTDLSDISTLVLSHNFPLSEKELRHLPALRRLVVDGSNNPAQVRRTEELSRNFDLEFYSTRQRGAYYLTLP